MANDRGALGLSCRYAGWPPGDVDRLGDPVAECRESGDRDAMPGWADRQRRYPEQVLRKCGAPASRVIELPQRRGGHVIEGAVTVERWVYGPRYGARYLLRFVAGKLVDERLALSP